MSGVNRAIVIGHIGEDPKISTTQAGKKVASFSVATSENWKDRDGNRHDVTDWHRVVVLSEGLVGVVEQYAKKGSKVYCEGQMKTRKWKDQQGNERSVTEVVLGLFRSNLQLLDRRESDRAPAHDGEEHAQTQAEAARPPENISPGNYGDVPF